MSSSSNYRNALDPLARDRGWTVTHTRGGHLRLTKPGCRMITASVSPPTGEHNLIKIAADMRRAER